MSEIAVHPLVRAVTLTSVTEIAKEIDITPQGVSKYYRRALTDPTVIVPYNWAIPIEKVTDGRVTRHEVRPDVYPLERAVA